MIVKNISGETRYFGFTRHKGARGRSLANNATATLPDNNPEVMQTVMNYVTAGVMQIVEGPAQNALVASVNTPANGTITASGAVSNADFVTVSGLKFKFAADPGDVSATVGTYSAILVAYWAGAGAAAAVAAGTLRTALVANAAATGIVADPVITLGSSTFIPLRAASGVIATTGLTLVKSGTNLAVSGATLTAGASNGAKRSANISHAATAGEVSAGIMFLPTALNSISVFNVQVLRAGVTLAWDGAAIAKGGTLVLDNSGSADWAAADVIVVFAQE